MKRREQHLTCDQGMCSSSNHSKDPFSRALDGYMQSSFDATLTLVTDGSNHTPLEREEREKTIGERREREHSIRERTNKKTKLHPRYFDGLWLKKFRAKSGEKDCIKYSHFLNT